jgi:hypothetical protein
VKRVPTNDRESKPFVFDRLDALDAWDIAKGGLAGRAVAVALKPSMEITVNAIYWNGDANHCVERTH